MKVDEENNFVSSKIIIHVKNSTSSILRNVVITEEIPALARYSPSNEPGALAPTRVNTSEYRASKLEWRFDEFEPKAERVLIYNVRGTFKVMKGFQMPPTVASYYKDGKEKTIYGGILRINV